MIFEIYVTNASIVEGCAVLLSFGFLNTISMQSRRQSYHILRALRPILYTTVYYPTALHSSCLVSFGRISFFTEPPVHPKSRGVRGTLQTAVRFWNVIIAETIQFLGPATTEIDVVHAKAAWLGAGAVPSRLVSMACLPRYTVLGASHALMSVYRSWRVTLHVIFASQSVNQ